MKLTKNKVVRIIVFFVCLICLLSFTQRYLRHTRNSEMKLLDDGWNIAINEKNYENSEISHFKVPALKKNDIVTLTKKLEKSSFEQAQIRVYTRYSALQVWLDEELLYESGQDEYQKGEVLGNGYHWVTLPKNYEGKTLRIVYFAGEKKAFTSIDPIYMIQAKQAYTEIVYDHFLSGVIASCIMVMGVASIFFCVVTGFRDTRFQMLLWMGLFSICVAIWLVSNTRLMEIFFENLQTICYLEYLGMYGACTSMLFYVGEFLEDKKQKQMIHILTAGMVLLVSILITLNQLDILHFPKTVLSFHIYTLFSATVIIFFLSRETAKKKLAQRVFLWGINVLVACGILELIRYRYNKLCIPAHQILQSIIPLGVILFILTMFASFFCRMMERVAGEMERKTLYDMAYKDALTGIRNRAWCEKVMQEYEKQSRPITIINMDMNHFKHVNDSLGHAAGDELLIRFAGLLDSTFKETDCVGRMGGDEFVVIMDYVEDNVVETYMKRLLLKIEEDNKKRDFPYEISVSYGYASDCTGQQETPWKIYEKADHKMYKYKKETRG